MREVHAFIGEEFYIEIRQGTAVFNFNRGIIEISDQYVLPMDSVISWEKPVNIFETG